MVETENDLFKMKGVCFSIAFFWGFIIFGEFFRGSVELIDLIGTHFECGFSLLIELISLLICEWRETVGCIGEVILFFIFENLIDFA